jgi:hypothetical protein
MFIRMNAVKIVKPVKKIGVNILAGRALGALCGHSPQQYFRATDTYFVILQLFVALQHKRQHNILRCRASI